MGFTAIAGVPRVKRPFISTLGALEPNRKLIYHVVEPRHDDKRVASQTRAAMAVRCLYTLPRRCPVKIAVGIVCVCMVGAAPVYGQGRGQAPPPPATDTVAPDIPGVVKAGTKVIVIKDDFQGTEGPIALPD